jgi:Dolichyl-phosphate-mannose-protein mannosyltransferase
MMPGRSRTLLAILLAIVAGTGLRLWFIHAYSQIQGDSLLYADIARNWLSHGIYGRTLASAGSLPGAVAPTLVRLPGYPAFLALCFAVFGTQNYLAVLYLQLVIDLAACGLVAGFVLELWGSRAAMIALWLGVLCPFTANYVAMPLTETLSIFCVALGLYSFARVLEKPTWEWMFSLTFAWSYAALLRPDGALLAVTFFPALLFYGSRKFGFGTSLRIALFCGLLAVLPFGFWTLRNWHTFHVFQPLAPRSATDPGEPLATGFQRWTKTWIVDFASTYEIYWNVPGDEIDIHALPARALGPPPDAGKTLALIAQYNDGNRLTPQMDAAFAQLAAERVQAHPIRSYVLLPWLRLVDMWFRPRVEMLNIELRWWQYRFHNAETRFAYAYGAWNLIYLLAALVGVFYWPRYAAVMVAYVAVRSLLLLTIEAPEPRYTLECFPMVTALAASAVDRIMARRRAVPTGRGS